MNAMLSEEFAEFRRIVDLTPRHPRFNPHEEIAEAERVLRHLGCEPEYRIDADEEVRFLAIRLHTLRSMVATHHNRPLPQCPMLKAANKRSAAPAQSRPTSRKSVKTEPRTCHDEGQLTLF